MISPSGRRVWVVGTGFLGAALLAHARAQGDRVLGIDRLVQEGVAGDASQPAVVAEACARLKPDLVYVCVSTRGGGAGEYRRAYAGVVRNVLRQAPWCRVVLCSSVSVYAGAEEVEEESAVRVDSLRVAALLEAEAAVLGAGGVAARLAALYGPGRCELLRRHVAGEPCLPGVPGRWLNYVHRDDAVRALYLLGRPDVPGGSVWNVCGESLRKVEAYAMLERVTGVPVSPCSSPPSRRGCLGCKVVGQRLRALGWAPQWRLEDFVREEKGGLLG